MCFYLILGRVMLTYRSFALGGWTPTPKGGSLEADSKNCLQQETTKYQMTRCHTLRHSQTHK